jgi:hypothetical protein
MSAAASEPLTSKDLMILFKLTSWPSLCEIENQLQLGNTAKRGGGSLRWNTHFSINGAAS